MINSKKRNNKEIGSSFFDIESAEYPNRLAGPCAIFSLSGRTSLRQIITDIKRRINVKTACLPSYCCESMIEPFLRENIEPSFYDVFLDSGKIVYSGDGIKADIILTLNYFGVDTEYTRQFDEELRKNHPDAVIIKDATHSLLSDRGGYDDIYDYVFASIRKWSGLSGGVILKSKSDIKPYKKKFTKYEDTVKAAMSAKKEYIQCGEGDKDKVLSLYDEAEEMLDSDYVGYGISKKTEERFRYFDVDSVAQKRKANYEILAEGRDIWHSKGIQPMRAKIMPEETPLFFPVIFQTEKQRNAVRKYLIANDVYCPIHWPISPLHRLNSRESEIYQTCLSVICDQRYDDDDMRRILGLIYNYKGEDI